MIFYTPSPDVAYENMWEIMSNVPLGQLMRDMHRLRCRGDGFSRCACICCEHISPEVIEEAAPIYLVDRHVAAGIYVGFELLWLPACHGTSWHIGR